MRRIVPILVAPRAMSREWDQRDLGAWSRLAPPSNGPVGEIWLQTRVDDLSSRTPRQAPAFDGLTMLGDLGRAPPRIRLVFPGRDVTLPSTAPVSFWTLLEPGSPQRRTGERIRAYEGAAVQLPGGCVALEVWATFLPRNEAADTSSLIRLPPVTRRTRATLAREDALSVEMWTLPPSSQLTPDGETCHLLVALTRGIRVDGRLLRLGEALFLPARGRTAILGADHSAARILIAYPDHTPTGIWRRIPGPDPMPGFAPRPQPSAPIAVAASLLNAPEVA